MTHPGNGQPQSRAGRLVTVGYEGRSVEEFMDRVVGEGVAVLVDVRQNAISRKPGFSKRALAEHCQRRGITYVHRPELGNPRDNRAAYRAGSAESRTRYLRHIEARGETLREIVRLLESRTVAVVCFEADHEECHRSLLAEQIRAASSQVSIFHA
jgi:uncharacterized protein (DUF488 family)